MRGRSLGVHVVLATQRPAGVVTGEIRANVNLRICLRVTSAGDSTDVLDVPDAARISKHTPGRALLRTGHGELSAFQAARVGWPSDGEARGGRPAAGSSSRGHRARRSRACRAADSAPRRGRPDRPQRPRRRHQHRGRRPRRARGGQPVAAAAAGAPDGARGGRGRVTLAGPHPSAVLGRIDRPRQQRQEPFVIDVERTGSLLIAGTVRSGRTTALRTLAAQLADRVSPADLHLYALDCGNRGLAALGDLPHCGAVVDGDDTERVERLLGMLVDELEPTPSSSSAAPDTARSRSSAAEVGRRRARPRRRTPRSPRDVRRPLSGARRWTTHRAAGRAAARRAGARPDVRARPATGRACRPASPPRSPSGSCCARPSATTWPSSGSTRAMSRPTCRPAEACGWQPARSCRSRCSTTTRRGRPKPKAYGGWPARRGTGGTALPPNGCRGGSTRCPSGSASASWKRCARSAPMVSATAALVAAGGDSLGPIELDLADEGPFVIAGPARSGRSTALLTIVRSLAARADAAPIVLVTPRPSPLRELVGEPGIVAVLQRGPDLGAELEDLVAEHAGRLTLVDRRRRAGRRRPRRCGARAHRPRRAGRRHRCRRGGNHRRAAAQSLSRLAGDGPPVADRPAAGSRRSRPTARSSTSGCRAVRPAAGRRGVHCWCAEGTIHPFRCPCRTSRPSRFRRTVTTLQAGTGPVVACGGSHAPAAPGDAQEPWRWPVTPVDIPGYRIDPEPLGRGRHGQLLAGVRRSDGAAVAVEVVELGPPRRPGQLAVQAAALRELPESPQLLPVLDVGVGVGDQAGSAWLVSPRPERTLADGPALTAEDVSGCSPMPHSDSPRCTAAGSCTVPWRPRRWRSSPTAGSRCGASPCPSSRSRTRDRTGPRDPSRRRVVGGRRPLGARLGRRGLTASTALPPRARRPAGRTARRRPGGPATVGAAGRRTTPSRPRARPAADGRPEPTGRRPHPDDHSAAATCSTNRSGGAPPGRSGEAGAAATTRVSPSRCSARSWPKIPRSWRGFSPSARL